MKRILICLDDSPRAPFVLATGLETARLFGARVILLRAIGLPPDVHKLMSADAGAGFIETMKQRAQGELDALTKGISPEQLEAVHVHVGVGWDTICREATKLDCDLVILGSHGYSGFDKLLGTTAAKVVNHCDRSVLVVRHRAEAAA